jgi:hypothetical protein
VLPDTRDGDEEVHRADRVLGVLGQPCNFGRVSEVGAERRGTAARRGDLP